MANTEFVGQYAIHIAVDTLKDRCRNLQQRIAHLEDENLNLRLRCNKYEEQDVSLTEIGRLQQQITELSEHKQQLTTKVNLVTAENQDLWLRLSKLAIVNKNLGAELIKFTNSVGQQSVKNIDPVMHSPLIRSKTFTQDEPHIKIHQRNLEENENITTELEEISQKLITSFVQEKRELELLCSEINQFSKDNIITDSFAFYYDDNDNLLKEFNAVLRELEATKLTIKNQRKALKEMLECIQQLHESSSSYIKNKSMDKETNTDDVNREENIENQSIDLNDTNSNDWICPICSKQFVKNPLLNELPNDFLMHVERHFID